MNIFNKDIDGIKKSDFLSGFVFLVIGLLLILLAMQHPIWTSSGPGEGFFPLLIGLVIVGTSSIIMASALRILIRQEKNQKVIYTEKKRSTDVFRVCSYGILMLLYGISIETIGFLISTILFVFLILKFVERRGWWNSVFYALSGTVIFYFLFSHILGVRLPYGLIKW
jgi:putative tricarboxylic transport membrane protein